METWFYLVLSLIIIICLYSRWESGYFKRKGMKNVPYSFPLIGNMMGSVTMSENARDTIARVYNAFPDEKYVGIKLMGKNIIMIRDTELIKQIAIKDFDNFSDHLIAITEVADSLVGKNIFSLKGQKWRDMRSTLTPVFSSSKLKNMFQFIVQVGEQMTDYFVQQMETHEFKERGLIEVEMKDAFSRYASDVIAMSVFGIKENSLADRENIFYEIGSDASGIGGIRLLKLIISTSLPKIATMFNIQMFSDRIKKFFNSLVLDAIQNRESQNIVRQDLINFLMEARKGSQMKEADDGINDMEGSQTGQKPHKRQWTDDELVAQALFFYIAGFETTASLLSFMAHELAINPIEQKKLQNEIDALALNEEGKLDYYGLMNMPYMSMVISECLRRWSPISITDRECLNQYNLPPPSRDSKKGCTVYKGESVMIPIAAIHHDPKYFPNPEKFDPERFSEANRENIVPFSFNPFGVGPRNCIGSRLALMEIKSVMFHLLKRFDFVKTAKTQEPITLATQGFSLMTKDGSWVGLKPRY